MHACIYTVTDLFHESSIRLSLKTSCAALFEEVPVLKKAFFGRPVLSSTTAKQPATTFN